MSNARNLGNITAGGATGATTASVTTSINNLIDASPGALNTLNELAAALGDDANFSTTVTNSIATKLPLAGGTMTGDINGNGNKVLFANVYAQIADLPSASTYHGMFAHVHATGKAYFAHAGAWIVLANDAEKANIDNPTFTTKITTPDIDITGGSQIGQDYAYLKSSSTTNTSLTLRKDSSGADSIDYLQLRSDANGLISKITGAGALGAGAGTVSLPSLSFVNDTNTGLYSPSADNLGFAIGGQNKAFFSTNQFNVDAKIVATELDINGNADISGNLAVTGKMGLGGSTHATAPLNITTTNQHMRLNNGSELGIIALLSSGELELWGHGDGESINFRTGSGSGTVAMNVVGTSVNIGGAVQTIGTQRLFIKGNKSGFAGDGYSLWQNQLAVHDESSPATGVGGAISLTGDCDGTGTGGQQTWLAVVEGYKQNATSGDYGGGLKLKVRTHNNATMQTGIYIQSNGYVLMPNQPSFSFPSSTNHSISTTGGIDMTSGNVLANVAAGTSVNVGNHFNTSNGRFTAPVAGVYEFTLTGATILYSGYNYVYLRKNGSQFAYKPQNQDADWMHFTISAYITLAVGDYVNGHWNNNYSGGHVGHVHFRGRLVG